MPWFKVDDTFSDHPKVDELSLSAVGLWTLSGSWSARNLTNGYVTPARVRKFGGTNAEVTELVTAGLWREDGEGWSFNSWDEYQPTKESVEQERAAARKRMQDYRAKKKKPGATSEGVTANNGERAANEQRSNAVGSATPTRPVPSPNKRASDDDAFNRFWSVYPRKVAKKAARTKWDTVTKTTDPEQIIEGARKYAKKCELERTEKNFIKQPDGWLNAGRWEDEIELTTIKATYNPWSKDAHVY
jgi:hypothetical protein